MRMLMLLSLALTLPGWALPEADKQGNYQQNSRYWEVWQMAPVKERTPLLGHAQPEQSSPATVRFPSGFVLQSQALARDPAGLPWLKVSFAPGQSCFVRAESTHLHPIDYEPVQPDARGNFPYRTLHRYWKVVDPDPAGLNARLHPNFPGNYEDPRVTWPSGDVRAWPVLRTFARGSLLAAVPGNVGMIIRHDSDQSPWLMVENPAGGICFVRAHKDFIRPVPGPFQILQP
jgi:hypothetical protein